ncbi:hypothetical protein [Streptomyces sp. WP-1]|uniref:hypothetical protein n=1 Tax=Streptomyces sp. WP-1 TaxID=3041497 RepID=UPI0026496721|nr:hypothetical protein [Streptomyces sp. WP-1]WKE69966.1 hypothetical protein QHG49_13385 [Streptomyces sp. WP-1]
MRLIDDETHVSSLALVEPVHDPPSFAEELFQGWEILYPIITASVSEFLVVSQQDEITGRRVGQLFNFDELPGFVSG